MQKFYKDLNIDPSSAESFIALYILKFNSLTEITLQQVEKALSDNHCKKVKDLKLVIN